MTNTKLPKKFFLCVLSAALFFGPFVADAQTPSNGTSWISKIFDWQAPLVSHLSSLFETRKDGVESTSVERNQLLDWHRGNVSIDAPASMTVTDSIDASSSPVTIPFSLYQEKKTGIVIALLSALNGLQTSRSELSDFIEKSSAQGKDMSTALIDLSLANAEIDDASAAVNSFEDYEPVATKPSDPVDLATPESDLNAATKAIGLARSALSTAIKEAGGSY